MSDPQPADTLASTARWTASVRAMEHAREDRLFADPWARLLAGEEGATWIAQRTPEAVVPIVLRTRFFDDFLRRISTHDAIRQVVLMAAGLDTRAFRLAWPEGTRIYELDRAPVLQYKETVLRAAGAQPGCWRGAVGADLAAGWKEALMGAGFDLGEPAGWLLEGFLFYLPGDAVTHVLEEVTSLAAPGSWLGFDIINGPMLTSPLTRGWVDMQARAGAPWIGTLDDPVGFLADRGWQAILTQAGAEDANHGRWPFPVIPVTMPGMPHNWFVVAKKGAPVLASVVVSPPPPQPPLNPGPPPLRG